MPSKSPKYERQKARTYANKMRRIKRETEKQAKTGHVYQFTEPVMLK